jgi:hypothetical protein
MFTVLANLALVSFRTIVKFQAFKMFSLSDILKTPRKAFKFPCRIVSSCTGIAKSDWVFHGVVLLYNWAFFLDMPFNSIIWGQNITWDEKCSYKKFHRTYLISHLAHNVRSRLAGLARTFLLWKQIVFYMHWH